MLTRMDTYHQTIAVDRELRLRRMTGSAIPLLARWRSDPRVIQFYEGRDGPHGEAMVREHYRAPDRSGIFQCIVKWRGQPVGYQQFYPSDPWEKVVYGCHSGDDVWGMDQFIGRTPALESRDWHGLGTARRDPLDPRSASSDCHHRPARQQPSGDSLL
jgi:aminoglycoside 6'-N-acetyltransferase